MFLSGRIIGATRRSTRKASKDATSKLCSADKGLEDILQIYQGDIPNIEDAFINTQCNDDIGDSDNYGDIFISSIPQRDPVNDDWGSWTIYGNQKHQLCWVKTFNLFQDNDDYLKHIQSKMDKYPVILEILQSYHDINKKDKKDDKKDKKDDKKKKKKRRKKKEKKRKKKRKRSRSTSKSRSRSRSRSQNRATPRMPQEFEQNCCIIARDYFWKTLGTQYLAKPQKCIQTITNMMWEDVAHDAFVNMARMRTEEIKGYGENKNLIYTFTKIDQRSFYRLFQTDFCCKKLQNGDKLRIEVTKIMYDTIKMRATHHWSVVKLAKKGKINRNRVSAAVKH